MTEWQIALAVPTGTALFFWFLLRVYPRWLDTEDKQ